MLVGGLEGPFLLTGCWFIFIDRLAAISDVALEWCYPSLR